MKGFLDNRILEDLKDAAVKAELYDPDKRKLLFFRIEYLRGKITPGGSPDTQLRLDINYLNVTPPRDGHPPLYVWLQNARPLVADTEAQDLVETLLQEKGGLPSGGRLSNSESVHNEAILFTDDMLPAGYLRRGVEVSRAVLRLRVPRFEGGVRKNDSYWGTGWLITSEFVITNYHVFNARNDGEPAADLQDFALQAVNTEAQFDVESRDAAPPFVPIAGLEAQDATLDFAIVRIAPVTDRKPLVLESTPVKIEKGQILPLNIIQHPQGDPKKIAIRNNLATASAAGDDIRYFTSTLGGSSGAPVLNDDWRVVALHRGSIGSKVLSFQGRTTAVVNLGTRVLSIVGKLPTTISQDLDLRSSW